MDFTNAELSPAPVVDIAIGFSNDMFEFTYNMHRYAFRKILQGIFAGNSVIFPATNSKVG